VKERPIICTADSVRAILEDRKTQTRRVMKPQPSSDDYAPISQDEEGNFGYCWTEYRHGSGCYPEPYAERFTKVKCPYGVVGDRLVIYCKHETAKRRHAKEDSNLSKLGLHGGIGRTYLLQNEVCWVREKSTDGLVCTSGTSQSEGLQDGLVVPSERKGHEARSSASVYGISRTTPGIDITGTPLERESRRQFAGQSAMGNPDRELAGSESAREALYQCDLQVHTKGARTRSLGCEEGIVFATSGRTYFGRFPVLDLRTGSPLTLELTAVRVERVQEISEEDAVAEGISLTKELPEWRGTAKSIGSHVGRYAVLWDSINAKRGYSWESNPWVWALTFRRVDASN